MLFVAWVEAIGLVGTTIGLIGAVLCALVVSWWFRLLCVYGFCGVYLLLFSWWVDCWLVFVSFALLICVWLLGGLHVLCHIAECFGWFITSLLCLRLLLRFGMACVS